MEMTSAERSMIFCSAGVTNCSLPDKAGYAPYRLFRSLEGHVRQPIPEIKKAASFDPAFLAEIQKLLGCVVGCGCARRGCGSCRRVASESGQPREERSYFKRHLVANRGVRH